MLQGFAPRAQPQPGGVKALSAARGGLAFSRAALTKLRAPSSYVVTGRPFGGVERAGAAVPYGSRRNKTEGIDA